MDKKILTGALAAMMISSTALAAPLSDYTEGSAAVDVKYSLSQDIKGESNGLAGKHDLDDHLSGGLTYGLGNNLAVQYNYTDNKLDFGGDRIIAQELNLLYKLNPNLSAYAGLNRNRYSVNRGYDSSETGVQIGVIGQTKLSDDLTAWAMLGAGNKRTAYEIGLGYGITDNLDLNIYYDYNKYKDNENALGRDFDAKAKGFGMGVTFKF